MSNIDDLKNSDKLIITKTIDREDLNYYPNNPIIITISLTNNSDETIENILIVDNLPDEVIPEEDDFYKINTTKGNISQDGHQISVHIDKIEAKEVINIKILGKIGMIVDEYM